MRAKGKLFLLYVQMFFKKKIRNHRDLTLFNSLSLSHFASTHR